MIRTATLAAAALLAATVSPPASAQDAIRIASPYKVTTLDPIRSAAAGNIEAFGQLYARLLRRDAEGRLAPGLAESWEVSDDGLTYTFDLRDAKFSDGTEIEADDVVFSLDRVAHDEQSAYPAAYAAIEEIAALNDDTVRITLKHPTAPLLSYMEIFNAGIVSKDDVESRGEDAFSGDPVTSGPYMVESWKPNDRLTLKANPNYWREGYPKTARADLIEVADANARTSMILAGEVDAVRSVPWAQIAEVDGSDVADVPLDPSTTIFVGLLNHGRAPFDDVRVRQAAAMALDREAMADAVTLGHAPVANSTLPAALTYYAEDLQGPPYDPAKARALLEEAGAAGKEIVLLIAAGNEQLATLLEAQWTAVGFKVKVERVDSGLWWDRLINGDYDATPNWWYNETEDPDLAVRWALCGTCGNRSYYTNYANPRIDELTEAALRELDPAKRGEMYREIQAISVEEVSQIPLYYPPHPNAYATRIKGLSLSPALQWSLEEAEIVGQ